VLYRNTNRENDDRASIVKYKAAVAVPIINRAQARIQSITIHCHQLYYLILRDWLLLDEYLFVGIFCSHAPDTLLIIMMGIVLSDGWLSIWRSMMMVLNTVHHCECSSFQYVRLCFCLCCYDLVGVVKLKVQKTKLREVGGCKPRCKIFNQG
jgi:hypothetical protein